ncbi:MAG: hypothetical protein ACT4P1_07380 [Sporichthyaceae bacterium]
MSERTDDLEFAALHADDVLLDALGSRHGSVTGADPIAGLLRAFAAEVDARPGPLASLLADEAVVERAPARSAVALAPRDTDGATAGGGVATATLVSHRRHRRALAPRAAAVAIAGAVVFGAGGVAAAVGGQGSPFEGLRRAVQAVTGQDRSDTPAEAERVVRLIDSADKALRTGDLPMARTLIEEADTRFAKFSNQFRDARGLEKMRSDLSELRERARNADPTGMDGTLPERIADDLVPEPALDPTDKLPEVPVQPDLGEAKDKLGDKLEDNLEDKADKDLSPLPDELPGPVGE